MQCPLVLCTLNMSIQHCLKMENECLGGYLELIKKSQQICISVPPPRACLACSELLVLTLEPVTPILSAHCTHSHVVS